MSHRFCDDQCVASSSTSVSSESSKKDSINENEGSGDDDSSESDSESGEEEQEDDAFLLSKIRSPTLSSSASLKSDSDEQVVRQQATIRKLLVEMHELKKK